MFEHPVVATKIAMAIGGIVSELIVGFALLFDSIRTTTLSI